MLTTGRARKILTVCNNTKPNSYTPGQPAMGLADGTAHGSSEMK